MKLYLGSDHAGFAMRALVRRHLEQAGHEVLDLGCETNSSCDYPTYGELVARAVAGDPGSLGVVVCGTGIGISIAANKVAGARAALCTNELMAQMARRHNDANVLALGARVLGDDLALSVVDAFLAAGFEGGRHARRVDLLGAIRP